MMKKKFGSFTKRYEKGIVEGEQGDAFYPDKIIAREEFVTMLYRRC